MNEIENITDDFICNFEKLEDFAKFSDFAKDEFFNSTQENNIYYVAFRGLAGSLMILTQSLKKDFEKMREDLFNYEKKLRGSEV